MSEVGGGLIYLYNILSIGLIIASLIMFWDTPFVHAITVLVIVIMFRTFSSNNILNGIATVGMVAIFPSIVFITGNYTLGILLLAILINIVPMFRFLITNKIKHLYSLNLK